MENRPKIVATVPKEESLYTRNPFALRTTPVLIDCSNQEKTPMDEL